MPISGEARRERPFQLRLVMDLDEHVEAELARRLLEALRLVVGDRGHDDEDAVGAPGPRLVHLVGIEHEILAQRGEGGGVARGGEEFRRALE